MRIESTSSLTFGNNSVKFIKQIVKKGQVYTDLKPIKNYAQYMREYGLEKEATSAIYKMA